MLVAGRERFSVARRAPLTAAFGSVPLGAGVVYTKPCELLHHGHLILSHARLCLPSGNRPVPPLFMCRPRYHPSPKSSSRSISSIRSPFARLSSSGLRATKSCTTSNIEPGGASVLMPSLVAIVARDRRDPPAKSPSGLPRCYGCLRNALQVQTRNRGCIELPVLHEAIADGRTRCATGLFTS